MKYRGDYSRLNRAAFNASASSVFTALNTADASIKITEYVSKAYSFCQLDANTTCSLITFYTLDENDVATRYHFPLTNGSCRDSITPKDASWMRLAHTPPTRLTETYYKCHSSSIDALINAVGVASGNTSIAMLLLLFVSVPLIFGFMACCRVIPKEQEFREKEKVIVLDTLATVLLRIRDKHYEALDPCGTVANLAEELIIATNFSYYEEEEEDKKKNNHKSSNNSQSVKSSRPVNLRQGSKQKSFRNFKHQRSLFGKERLYRTLAETSCRLPSLQRSARLQGVTYRRLASMKKDDDAVIALTALEEGDTIKDLFEDETQRQAEVNHRDALTEDKRADDFSCK